MDEAAMTRKLLGLIVKKTNRHFDQFCEALHQAGQTYVVHNLLITPGTVIVSKQLTQVIVLLLCNTYWLD